MDPTPEPSSGRTSRKGKHRKAFRGHHTPTRNSVASAGNSSVRIPPQDRHHPIGPTSEPQLSSFPPSIAPASHQRPLDRNTAMGGSGLAFPSISQDSRYTESYPTESRLPYSNPHPMVVHPALNQLPWNLENRAHTSPFTYPRPQGWSSELQPSTVRPAIHPTSDIRGATTRDDIAPFADHSIGLHDSYRVNPHQSHPNAIFSNSRAIVNGGNFHVHNTYASGASEVMRTLKHHLDPSNKADHRHILEGKNLRRGACTPGTRVTMLSDIIEWASDCSSNVPLIYWLFGQVGSGKTTIAFTIARDLRDTATVNRNIVLGGTFFCSRHFSETRIAGRIIPTIAYQLAEQCRAFADALARYANVDTIHHSFHSQLENLLIVPWVTSEPNRLVDSSNPSYFVFIIDALDEIEGTAGVEFLRAVFDVIKDPRLRGLKFFATSRPEHSLVDHVHAFPDKRLYHLESIPPDEAKKDIRTYFSSKLNQTLAVDIIEKLVEHADGLFIYAATIFKYLDGHKRREQMELLHRLFQSSPSGVPPPSSNRTHLLDELYLQIMEQAFHDIDDSMKERRLHVLHTFLCTAERTTISTVAQLLDDSGESDSFAEIVQDVFERLYAVLFSDGENILWYHKSFPDFIFSQTRSGQFWCDETSHHRRLTETCFRILKHGLRFNIANIESSYLLDCEIFTLPSRIEQSIPPILRYACQYWGYHLATTRLSTVDDNLIHHLSNFIQLPVLFWIEAMNLLGQAGQCHGILTTASEWAKNHDSRLGENFTEAAMFAVYFSGSPATSSTPHLYISALATWPRHMADWRLHFPGIPHFTNSLRQVNTIQLLRVQVGGFVESVAFSPNGHHIVSGSGDKSVRVWDAATGKQLKELIGHEDWVASVVFSPDGHRIVSGSHDGFVRVWDAATGKLKTLIDQRDSVRSVVFSPDSHRIVSGSRDGSVRVWDAETGEQLNELIGHQNSVRSVAFSPDGYRIVSGSDDKSMRVWDLHSRNHYRVREKYQGNNDYTGWIRSALNRDRLMFVFDSLFPDPSNILTIPSSASSSVDMSKASLGTGWYRCYQNHPQLDNASDSS